MLVEIQCDKFLSNGNVRPPIRFHSGLNTVIGSHTGTNSIGKSTFLMIIDFVFGGNDYIERSNDIQNNVGIHTINFTFEFAGKPYYFSRSTGDFTMVNECNSSYSTLSTISLDSFNKFLQKQYQLELSGLSFRSAVSRYIRVYKRENLDEIHPLHTFKKETDKHAIEGLMQIYDKYSSIEELSKIADGAKDEETTFKKAQKYNYIPYVSNKTSFKNNEIRIKELLLEKERLAEKSTKDLLDLDSLQAEQLASLKNKLSGFRRQRTRLNSRLRSIQTDKDVGKKNFQKNYYDLEQFFPDADIKKLEEIETFHRQLSTILKSEFKESEENLLSMIALADSEIQTLEKRISEINTTPNLTKAVLDQYSETDKEVKQLIAANNNYEKTYELHSRTKELEDRLNNLILEQIAILQDAINRKMNDINNFIYDGKKTAPILTISDAKHYSFITPNDSGTGSQYKGLIAFDLASLEMTHLPVLVHDSVILKQIADEAVERILELYTKTAKQVFIALDKGSSYTSKSQEILKKTEVLSLSSNGNELFGRPWNEIKN